MEKNSIIEIERLHDNADQLEAEAVCPCGGGMSIILSIILSIVNDA